MEVKLAFRWAIEYTRDGSMDPSNLATEPRLIALQVIDSWAKYFQRKKMS